MTTIYSRRTYRFKLNHNHPYYKQLVEMTKASKNLYNKALYESRQNFFQTGKFLQNTKLRKEECLCTSIYRS